MSRWRKLPCPARSQLALKMPCVCGCCLRMAARPRTVLRDGAHCTLSCGRTRDPPVVCPPRGARAAWPLRSKKSYAPLFHAASRKVRRDLYDGYRAFVAAFREAAARLRDGNLAGVFPAGSFPPALPFVGG